MSRLLFATILGFVGAGTAAAQCHQWSPWYPPVYPVNPATFWGTPQPKPMLPAPKPFVPKPGVGIKEEEEPVPPKSKNGESKEKEPRIPKVKLPGLPDDPDEPRNPKKDTPNKEPATDVGKSVDQYIIPAEGNKAERPAEVKVGFFNHSEREIVLEVNGETLKLPSEQYVTLRLKRTFTWGEKGQKATDVAVPPDADGLEFVFRK
jgi:hypothetical protein